MISPTADLLFVCGGAMILLAAMHQMAMQHFAAHQLSYLFNLSLLGALLFGETHTVATIFGVYGDRHCRNRNGRFSLLMALFALTLLVAICSVAGLAPYVVRIYLLSVSWHFIEQTRGIIIMYFVRNKYQPTSWQSMIWDAVLRLTMLNWVLVQLCDFFDNRGEVFLLQKLAPLALCPRPWVQIVAWMVVCLVILSVSNVAWRAFKSQSLPPVPAIMLLLVAVGLFLPIGPCLPLQQSLWLYAPALFHGSQYLCVMACRLSQPKWPSICLASLTKQYGLCFCLSTFVFIALPWLLAFVFAGQGLNFAVALVAVFVSVQFYHMAMDSVIWRRPVRGVLRAQTNTFSSTGL